MKRRPYGEGKILIEGVSDQLVPETKVVSSFGKHSSF
jgi:hypothetical protein